MWNVVTYRRELPQPIGMSDKVASDAMVFELTG